MRMARFFLLMFATSALLACAEEPERAIAARRDFQSFQREVYPVLLRDCGFPACHGAPERFLRVWGPGRNRLLTSSGIAPGAFDIPTGDELSNSFELAKSMIDERDRKSSPLLRKPLAAAAGGAGHLGVDNYGRDIYRTQSDTGYVTIARWVLSDPPPPRGTMMTAP
jgi:hypothetical protein